MSFFHKKNNGCESFSVNLHGNIMYDLCQEARNEKNN